MFPFQVFKTHSEQNVFRERTICKKWLNPNTLEIRSPNYPFDYGNNVRCGWDITAKPGFTTWLRVLDYNVRTYTHI